MNAGEGLKGAFSGIRFKMWVDYVSQVNYNEGTDHGTEEVQISWRYKSKWTSKKESKF